MWIRRAITVLVVACTTAIAMLWWLSQAPMADRTTNPAEAQSTATEAP